MTKKKINPNYENLLERFQSENDPLIEMMKFLLKQLMESEVSKKVNSEKGVHDDERTGYRSGYRERRFDTRLGTIDLAVPKIRNGGYVPFFMKERQRCEQALIHVVHECYMNGVSTRKIEHLAQSLGIEDISAGEVSEINKGLDEMVSNFRNRELEEEYPVIWADALYEKIREGNRIVNMAVMVIKAINMDGKPDILAIEPMQNESEETYTMLFNDLKKRGVKKVWLCVSDAHMRLRAAITKCWAGASWQRCKVHFMRNILALVPQKDKARFAARLKSIWTAPDAETARKWKDDFIQDFESEFKKACDCLEEGFEDSIQFYEFDKIDSRKISSTNTLERLNEEIRRRTKVVGVFPNEKSYIRLVTSYLLEYAEDHLTGTSYIKAETLKQQKEVLLSLAA